jgi:hypothetical protein
MSTVSQIANGGVYLRHTSGSNTVLSAENSSIYLRPRGDTDIVGQCVIDNLGNLGVTGTVTAPTFIGALTGNASSATNADQLDGQHGDWYRKNMLQFTDIPLISSAGANDLNTILTGGGMITNYQAGSYWANAPENNYAAAVEFSNGYSSLQAQLFWSINHNVANATKNLYFRIKNNLGYGQWEQIAFITSNVASATKLQTARTIWGQSFDGTGNVTGALSGATTIAASISVTTPKVIFAAAGWSMEQVGSELQMKHNNVLKMRFTSAGSIVATEEITAFG